MKTMIINQAKQGIISMLLARPIHFVKDIKTVTVAVSYTTRTQPDVSRGKEFTLDVDKTKASIQKIFRRGERDMAAYKYKIVWLNEMGEEQSVFVETAEERDTKIQALADDGYSPVWREVEQDA